MNINTLLAKGSIRMDVKYWLNNCIPKYNINTVNRSNPQFADISLAIINVRNMQ